MIFFCYFYLLLFSEIYIKIIFYNYIPVLNLHTDNEFYKCLYLYVCAKSFHSCSTLCNTMTYRPARLLCPCDSPDKNTGLGHHALLQGIFLTQGLNPRLLMSPALTGGCFTTSATWEAHKHL